MLTDRAMLTDSRQRTGWGEPAYTAPATKDHWRLLGTAAVAAVAAFSVMAGLWLTGVAGSEGGWAWSALAVAAAAVCAGWFIWGPRRGRMTVMAVMAVLATAGVAAGMWLAATLPMGHGRLWSAMDEVFPQATTVSGADGETGNYICFDECPSVQRTWVVAGSMEEAQAGVAETLQRAGYDVGNWRPAMYLDGTELEGNRGRVHVVVRVREPNQRREAMAQERSGNMEVMASMETLRRGG